MPDFIAAHDDMIAINLSIREDKLPVLPRDGEAAQFVVLGFQPAADVVELDDGVVASDLH